MMTKKQCSYSFAALGAALALGCAFGAEAQSTTANTTTGPSSAAASTPDAAKALEDRVVALMQAHKCAAAVNEARKGGNDILAQQVADVCGVKPNGGGPARSGGGGEKGGDRPGPPQE